jgi:hypothetical protein
MPAQRHTKESIVSTLQSVAANLGKTTLSKADVQGVLPVSSVRNVFGSLGKALEAAGLPCQSQTAHLNGIRRVLTDDELLQSIYRVEQKLGREPNANEYTAEGDYSVRPFRKRFGAWRETLAHYRRWRAERGMAIAENGAAVTSDAASDCAASHAGCVVAGPKRLGGVAPIQLYGEPFDFRGLRHAPINEQGVVYLFGMVSRELGFYVESIQQGFPDCEAKYLYDKGKNLWAKARIEFEFKASSFREHGHDASRCDFIVCWANDWPDCPVRVIELKKELLRLNPR